MDVCSVNLSKIKQLRFGFLFFMTLSLFSTILYAQDQKPLNVAYIGYHQHYYPGYWGGNYIIYQQENRSNTYWTGWIFTHYRNGMPCEKNCLINRWNGKVISCQRRCMY